EHCFIFRNARPAVHRLWLDRADALQTQRHLKKDFALSWHSRAEFLGHPTRTADRSSEAAEVSAHREASERRGVVRDFTSVIRWKRRAISRTRDFYSREIQQRRHCRGIH